MPTAVAFDARELESKVQAMYRDVAEKPHGATVDHFFRIESRGAVYLAAKAHLRVFVGTHDTGLGLTEARQHFLRIVADG